MAEAGPKPMTLAPSFVSDCFISDCICISQGSPEKQKQQGVCVCVYIERFILRNWLATEEAVESKI